MKNKTRRITALLVMVCIMAANFIFVSEVHAANTVDTAYASCQRISAGGFHSLALKSDGTVVGWGYNNYQQTTIPVGLSDVGAIAAGYNHSLALKSDGTVVGWGYNVNGETTIPWGLSDVVAIAAGNFHSLALKSNGTVDGWGNNDYGQTTIPTGLSDVGAIAAGYKHSLALKSNGTVDGWGYNNYGQATIPWGLSDVVAIAAGGSHSLALKSDGTVAGWGFNDDGQTTIPWGLSDVVAIAAGGSHSLALKSDGTVAGWGSNNNGQTTIPSGLSDVVAIAAGSFHSLALKSDGTVIGWGFNDDGQTTIPTGLNLSPRLSNLFVKSQLLPGFDPNILDYNLPDVANSVAELSVMPILEYPGNTNLTVNGTVKDSATTTTIPLNVGDNTIEIKVDFKDEELARTYTLHIRRDLPSVTNAHLDNLTINTGILTPNFDSDTENYSVSVDNVVANIEISLTPADSLAVASVNGLGGGTGTQMISVPLDEGDNDLVISVRASDNTTIKTYTLHITRGPSSNADLVGLSVNGGTLNPVFTPKTVSYAVTGIGGVSSVNIIAIGDKPGLTLTINGEAAQSAVSESVYLKQGANLIPIVVTAPDGSTQRAYILSINGTVDNANLSSLTVSEGNLSFDKDTTQYYVNVGKHTETIDVNATAADSKALVIIDGSVTTSSAINLTAGDNLIEIMVVAQDASTKTYQVIVTRKEELTISNVKLPIGIVGGTYHTVLTAEGGTAPYTWTATGLPSELTLSVTTGEITGALVNEGNYTVEVKVTDDNGNEASKTLAMKVNMGCGNGAYNIQPKLDLAYAKGYTADGIPMMTVKEGISGFRYFSVDVEPVTGHSGYEVCIFVHFRNGQQIGIMGYKADYDSGKSVEASFNVQKGDIIKAYIVDDLTNDPDINPDVL